MCSKTHDLRGRCGTRQAEDTDMSRRSTTTTSPGSTSRSYVASMRSSAQVSDANTMAPLARRPITRGLKPNGSRTARSLSAVRNSSE
ncbi:Os01g0873200 [Oryza sativa Japonica Group]|uniref:Os01g0873200 protein n=2 Tax=Oryza sativa subsp. japonica TaxID=39947 RepID=Q0JHB2_ORYSJ|nr:hypothetical protein EE612_007106 [Oryza sativa]BAF06866.1 Os01g0873200 [Oryza sativa Japonica Group]BAS75477.1 Os01g0873200 [Oryza sativa Japonica Group]|eukprot:NP_001044952.1 Os01g0873200 [Oryza sativa Japonica Group]